MPILLMSCLPTHVRWVDSRSMVGRDYRLMVGRESCSLDGWTWCDDADRDAMAPTCDVRSIWLVCLRLFTMVTSGYVARRAMYDQIYVICSGDGWYVRECL